MHFISEVAKSCNRCCCWLLILSYPAANISLMINDADYYSTNRKAILPKNFRKLGKKIPVTISELLFQIFRTFYFGFLELKTITSVLS